MFQKEWSRGLASKVVASLATVVALTSFGFSSTAQASCIPQPDGSCKPGEVFINPKDGATQAPEVIIDPVEGQHIKDAMDSDISGTLQEPVIAVDFKQVHFPDVKPMINPATSRTMVPLRFVAEAMGAAVKWEPAQPELVVIKRGSTTVELTIGDRKALVNGRLVEFDAPSMLVDDMRTLVPLRFISEVLGSKVDWVGEKPEDPRVATWDGKYQVFVWVPWGYFGSWSLGDRFDLGNVYTHN